MLQAHRLTELLGGPRTVERVDPGSGLLEDAERLDQRRGHALSVASNVEVDERTLGLGTPVAVARDLERAKGVGLGTESSSRLVVAQPGRRRDVQPEGSSASRAVERSSATIAASSDAP